MRRGCGSPKLPRVDRAQRLGSGDHADRAVRVDDRHARLPGQPDPDKLHVALLELLGVQLHGPTAARTHVRFRLAAPPDQPVEIPEPPPRSGRCAPPATSRPCSRSASGSRSPRRGRPRTWSSAAGATRRSRSLVGQPNPRAPTGFRSAARRRSTTPCTSASTRTSPTCCSRRDRRLHARGAGVDPEDAAVALGDEPGGDRWADAEVLSDRTGGFNYGSGIVEVQCPADAGAVSLGGRSLRWLRCRLDAP